MEPQIEDRNCFICHGWVRENCGVTYRRYWRLIVVHGDCTDQYETRNPNSELWLG